LLLESLQNITWRTVADIVLVALLFYQIISMLKGTRAAQIVVGLLVIFFAFLISSLLQFETLNWLISKFYSSFIIVVIVLFQDDIRRLLSRFGRGPFISGIDEREGADVIENVVIAAGSLSHDRIGALVVFERGVGLDKLYDRSVPLDAVVTEQLLQSIFHTFSPLHDGAVIIQKNRVACASAHLPLSKSTSMSRKLGTRHSAALGISEETDAVVLVISEETGSISIAYGGRLEIQSSVTAARETLTRLLLPLGERPEGWLRKSAGSDAGVPGRTASADLAGIARPDRDDVDESAKEAQVPAGTAELPFVVRQADLPDGLPISPEVPSDSFVLQDVRKLSKLGADDKFKPPVMPAAPPGDVNIGGVKHYAPVGPPATAASDSKTQDSHQAINAAHAAYTAREEQK
jgi:diadenylate cyclase